MSNNRTEITKSQGRGFGGGHGGPGGALGRPVEKAKDFKGSLLRLMEYIKPVRFKLVLVCLISMLSTLFSILSPKITGLATTKLFQGVVEKADSIKLHTQTHAFDFGYIWRIILILACMYIFSALFNYVQSYVMAGIAQKIVYNMRREVNSKLSRLPIKFYDSKTHGEIMSRATNDVDNIASTLQQSMTQLITSIITIVGVVVLMLTISPILTLITLVTLPMCLLVTMMVAKRSQKYFIEQQKSLGELNGHVEEMLSGHTIIKAFGHEKNSIKKFDEISEKLYNSGWKAQFISGIIMPLMSFINNIGYVIVSVAGGILVIRKAIQIGDVQAFIQYSKQFTQPITQAANIANVIQSTVASAERVFELLDEKEELPDDADARVIELPKGEVAFEEVEFGYKADTPVIRDMNLHVGMGKTIAIVGPTGAGKTTLVNLLMRFYETNSGSIKVDGIDITRLKRGKLREMFGMVLQDTWLFSGTIKENIAYGRKGATDEEIIMAAKAAHADRFIRTLPDGYDTVLNEEASNISQGQKQLLTIARAILADPPVLILDEATSSVDTRTETYIQNAMTELMKGRTSFVIAHRLSTIRNADTILVMNNGSIIEQGNHKELLAKGGFYADLYNSQFTEAAMEQSA